MTSSRFETQVKPPKVSENVVPNDRNSRPRPQIPEPREDDSFKVEPLPLEFITLTGKSASEKAKFSYTIRSRAMQSFIQSKNHPSPETQPSIYQGTGKIIQSSGQLSGKFKLSTWSRKPRGPRKVKITKALNEIKGSDLKPRLDGILVSPGNQTFITGPLQPYGPLPIQINLRTQKVLHHYNTGFISNAFAVNYDNAWKPFSVTDAALLHVTLSLAAQHQDILRDDEDSRDSLYHRGQAMRLMNQRLLNLQHYISDADVTSVAMLVILESINGTFEASKAHGIGLLRMIGLRGGLSRLEQNPVLLRVLAWSDIVSSTRWGNPPNLSTLSPPHQHLPSTLSKHATFDLPPSYISTSLVLDFEIAEILETLQHMSHAIDIPDLSLSDKKCIADALYSTEYRILSLEHSSSESLEMSALSGAFVIASLLYLQLAIREFSSLVKVHERLLARLLVLLQSISWDEISGLQESRDVLLWIGFIAAAASGPGHPAREQFLLIAGAVESDREKVSESLRKVAWRPSVCEKLLAKIWTETAGD